MSRPTRRSVAALLLPGLLAALLVAAAGPARVVAQDGVRWPTPPAGWWTGLQGGERATYEVRQGERAARRILRLEKVEGSWLTLSLDERSQDGATALGCATARIDAQGPEVQGDLNLPAGATLTRTGQEEVVVGAHRLACDIYEVTLQSAVGQVTMTAWHCPRLPPVFMGGTVRLRSTAMGASATITLVDYEGRLLELAPSSPRPASPPR